jgi:hypothetical protein
MYYPIIRQCIQALKNLETWLDKAEQHAAAKGFDVGVLLTSRLAPDMKDFIYQVQSACDYSKGAAALLSGQKPPRHADSEQTIDEVRARIRRTVDFAESVKEAQYAGASERRVSLSWGHGKTIGVRTTYCRWSSRTSISTSPWPTPSSATTASTSAKGTFAVQSLDRRLTLTSCRRQDRIYGPRAFDPLGTPGDAAIRCETVRACDMEIGHRILQDAIGVGDTFMLSQMLEP